VFFAGLLTNGLGWDSDHNYAAYEFYEKLRSQWGIWLPIGIFAFYAILFGYLGHTALILKQEAYYASYKRWNATWYCYQCGNLTLIDYHPYRSDVKLNIMQRAWTGLAHLPSYLIDLSFWGLFQLWQLATFNGCAWSDLRDEVRLVAKVVSKFIKVSWKYSRLAVRFINGLMRSLRRQQSPNSRKR
jgi:hypothetical protein